jgi:hypothetical protein
LLDDTIVLLFFDVVQPQTFHDASKVVLFDKVVNPDAFNEGTNKKYHLIK